MPNKLINRLPFVKTLWREVFHRPGWYNNSYDKLEHLYQWTHDPWNFDHSEYEQERFRSLLEMINQLPHQTILEVGCAEGSFTSRLSQMAQQVIAIDVSSTAIARARQRCPSVQFFQRSLEDFVWDTKFDVVLCAETLYYLKDIHSAVQRLSSLGKFCVVSYNAGKNKRLDPFFLHMLSVKYQRYEKSNGFWKRGWTIVTWENIP
ncbi:MAG: methyltransferase domain-containing protein [Ignavibacteriae bacterium]|nr:methyltransferase domain-containing protein [Ignavibacteriota bacterium]